MQIINMDSRPKVSQKVYRNNSKYSKLIPGNFQVGESFAFKSYHPLTKVMIPALPIHKFMFAYKRNMENSMEVSKKLTLGHTSGEKLVSKVHMHPMLNAALFTIAKT